MAKQLYLNLPANCILICLLLLTSFCADQKKSAQDLRNKAQTLMEEEKYDSALIEAHRSKKLDSILGDHSGEAQSLFILSRASAFQGDFNAAKEYAEEGAIICKSSGDTEMEYRLNNMLSWSYFELGVDINKILKHEERQLWIVDQLDDENAKANTYNNYGYDATVAGTIPLDKAIDYARFANDYYARTEANQGRWYSLMNLNWQYRLKNDLDKSEEYGLLSAKQAMADEDRHAIVEANTQLAETYLAKKEIEKAVPYYEEGLKWRGDTNDRDGYVFDVYYSRYLWETGQRDKAIVMLEQAVDYLQHSEVFYEMHGRALLADYYQKAGNSELAKNQISIIENPRSNFISLEARCLAAVVKRRLANDQEDPNTQLGIEELLNQAGRIGAEHLAILLESY